MSLKLFAIYIGGEHPGANIEVHDMRFVAAPSIEDTYEALKRQWWGRPGSLHIDCWSELSHADGYEIALRPEPFFGPERLFYVNLGGYDRIEFAEKHRNVFVVASLARDVPIKRIYRGVLPFVASDIIRLGICVAFPALSLYLVKLLN